MTTPRFSIVSTDDVVIQRPALLDGYYVLSPCVWKEDSAYHALIRVVNYALKANEKVARIHYARGLGPLTFTLDENPNIMPGPGADDRDGCEDPTLAKHDGRYEVFYSGWNQARSQNHLLRASGSDIRDLKKCGRVFSTQSPWRNPKEATVVQAADGRWRMFFEYAEDDRSKIGLASCDDLRGPWRLEQPPFAARSEGWDSWHLSTGPVIMTADGQAVMFYNGSTRTAQWCVGWIEFDAAFTQVRDRCELPLIGPPARRREPEDTDIAFAASAVQEDDHIGLYYSVADRWLLRARVNASDHPVLGTN